MPDLACSGVLDQGGVKSTVFRVFEDLSLKFQKATSEIEVFLSLLKELKFRQDFYTGTYLAHGLRTLN